MDIFTKDIIAKLSQSWQRIQRKQKKTRSTYCYLLFTMYKKGKGNPYMGHQWAT